MNQNEQKIEQQELEKRLGYSFHNKRLLQEALTHSSYSNEGKRSAHNNERLEFLGDSVLSVVVSEHLFRRNPGIPEGELSKLRASIVCEQSLFGFAKEITLNDYILLGKGEENTGGRERPSIVSDAFEAVIAAIFLDGGLEQAKQFILRFVPDQEEIRHGGTFQDYKTMLQEIIQQNKEEMVEYALVSESGPDHDKTFSVEVRLNSNIIGKGTGKSKKQAEQLAAKEALDLMGYET